MGWLRCQLSLPLAGRRVKVFLMSKADILSELPNLPAEERDQVLRKLCELQEEEIIRGPGPGAAEKRILDDALAEFQRDGKPGTPWREVLQRLRRKPSL